MSFVIYRANDNLIEVLSLKDLVADQYINDATVEVTLKTQAGIEVGYVPEQPSLWPVTLNYVTNSNGDYRTTLESTLPLTAHDALVAEIDADGGQGRVAFWKLPVVVLDRTS